MEGFKYVIEKPKSQKIFFGSGCPRDVLGQKDLNYYMRHYTLENNREVAPWTYNPLKSFNIIYKKPNCVSKKGYGGVIRQGLTKNVKDEPAARMFWQTLLTRKPNNSKYPFDSSTERSLWKFNRHPGPGDYCIERKKPSLSFQHCFGGRARMNLAVEIKCCHKNTDFCLACNAKPVGDYWHRNYKEYLCHKCMLKKRKEVKRNKHRLKEFRRIRDCSSIHCHDGTEAKTWLVDPKIVAKCLQKEAYLSLYLDN